MAKKARSKPHYPQAREVLQELALAETAVREFLQREGSEALEPIQTLPAILSQAAEALRNAYAVEEQRHSSAERLKVLFERATDAYLLVLPDGRLLDVNQAAEAVTGYSRAELVGSTLRELNLLAAGPGERWGRLLAAKAADMPMGPYEITLQTRGGRLRATEMRTFPISFYRQRLVVLIVRDITARRQAEEREAVLREVDARVLAQQPLDQILQFVCQRLCDLFSHPLVWIGLKEPDGSVLIRGRAGAQVGFLNDIEVRWDEPPATAGPAGAAVVTGQVQVCRVDSEQSWPQRARAKAMGLCSVVALPLTVRSQTIGVLALYAGADDDCDEEAIRQLAYFAARTAVAVQAALDRQRLHLLGTAVESAANSVVITDRQGTILWINPAFNRFTGYTLDEVIGRNPRLLNSGKHAPAFFRHLWQTILAGQVWRGEIVNRHKSGRLYSEERTITPVCGEHNEITHFIGIGQDTTLRRQQEQLVSFLSTHDPLTGLPNRLQLEQTLERVVERARGGVSGCLMFMDLDNFKLVNDTLGHAAGDQMLIVLSRILQQLLRTGDLLARFGGDEFAVVMEGVDLAEAHALAARLRQAVEAYPFSTNGHNFHLSLSIGLVPISGQHDAGVVLSQADAALFSAKEQGRNRVVLYRPEDDVLGPLSAANRWVVQIKEALRSDRFRLCFQPVIRLGDGQVHYHEVLLRLCGDDGELIPPDAFIPAAESFGLMPQIDRWVVQQVVALLQAHPQARLSVNLSGRSLADEALLEFVEERLVQSGVQPGRLGFELTETAVVQDLLLAERWLHRLKAQGCRFALDDFGSGFNSFLYLRRLPVDVVKIDGSFINSIDTDPVQRAMVRGMHELAGALGMETVAEFVGSAAAIDLLRAIGVTYGQGHFLGQPVADFPAVT